jgi:anti-sigma factor RsiW
MLKLLRQAPAALRALPVHPALLPPLQPQAALRALPVHPALLPPLQPQAALRALPALVYPAPLPPQVLLQVLESARAEPQPLPLEACGPHLMAQFRRLY